jgi:hypothetical protein
MSEEAWEGLGGGIEGNEGSLKGEVEKVSSGWNWH